MSLAMGVSSATLLPASKPQKTTAFCHRCWGEQLEGDRNTAWINFATSSRAACEMFELGRSATSRDVGRSSGQPRGSNGSEVDTTGTSRESAVSVILCSSSKFLLILYWSQGRVS